MLLTANIVGKEFKGLIIIIIMIMVLRIHTEIFAADMVLFINMDSCINNYHCQYINKEEFVMDILIMHRYGMHDSPALINIAFPSMMVLDYAKTIKSLCISYK